VASKLPCGQDIGHDHANLHKTCEAVLDWEGAYAPVWEGRETLRLREVVSPGKYPGPRRFYVVHKIGLVFAEDSN